jgi:nitrous oxidase accessory protein NosD
MAQASPAVAQVGTTYYVDHDTGDDANDCTTIPTFPDNVGPCQTIGRAIDVATDGATIRVDDTQDGSYGENLTVSEDLTIRPLNFAPDENPSAWAIDGGGDFAIDTTSGSTLRLLPHQFARFTLRSDATAVRIRGAAVIRGQSFDNDADGSTGLTVASPASNVVVEGNTFSYSGSGGTRTGISLSNTGPNVQVRGNGFTGLGVGVKINGGGFGMTVADNVFSGLLQTGPSDGRGIYVVSEAAPTISHNSLTAPATENVIGIEVSGGASAELRRNYVDGFQVGVVTSSAAEISLDSDLLVRNQAGLFAISMSGTDPVRVTNATIYDNAQDISLAGAVLTLDSSAISSPIDLLGGDPNCTITFSRGPTTTGDACQTFQTSAPPQFADPNPDDPEPVDEAEDYELTAGSPLIEMGNPAVDNTGSTLDQEGDPRRLDGDGNCVFRRDIGADEFVPATDAPCITDTYADAETGDDSAFPCSAPITPCKTIGLAIAAAGAGDTVHVDSGAYTESVALDRGKSLIADDFVPADGAGPPELTAPGRDPAITVPAGESAGTIGGLTIGAPSALQAVLISGPVTVTHSTFPLTNEGGATGIFIEAGGDDAVVSDNTLTNEDGVYSNGIVIHDSAPLVSGNELDDLNYGVTVFGETAEDSPEISQNHITGARAFSFDEGGRGIDVQGGSPLLKRNVIEDADPAFDGNTAGIHVGSDGIFAEATLVGNRISGHGTGIDVVAPTGTVRLRSDLVTGNVNGLYIVDTFGGPADVQNLTAFDNSGDDIQLYNAQLHLDSSIVGKPIRDPSDVSTCTITFSRGPADTGGNCAAFSVTAPPGFVNSGGGDYHLSSTSPLVDQGNPAAPAAGEQDFDGDPRALPGKHTCSADVLRRDMGAPRGVGSGRGRPPGTGPAVRTVDSESEPQTEMQEEAGQEGRRGRQEEEVQAQEEEGLIGTP